MARPKTKVQRIIQRALKGDKDALDYLAVESGALKQAGKSMKWKTICSDYHYAAVMYTAAENLEIEPLRRTSQILLGCLAGKASKDNKAFDRATVTLTRSAMPAVMISNNNPRILRGGITTRTAIHRKKKFPERGQKMQAPNVTTATEKAMKKDQLRRRRRPGE